MKGIIIGLGCYLCFELGYQMRKYETKTMPEMVRGLCGKALQDSTRCMDELDRCKEECE